MTADSVVLDSKRDRDEWLSLLRVMPSGCSDIYFHPDYCNLYLNSTDHRSVLFVYKEETETWIYPFIMRNLPTAFGITGCDIESPYGYGGPVATSNDPALIERANSSFSRWCESQCVVAEFIRLHPLLNNHRWLGTRANVAVDRETVSLSLGGLPDSSIAFSGNAGNMVRRAIRAGVSIEVDDLEQRFPDFVDLYRRTMDRLQGDEFYYFNDDHFSSLKALVSDHGWLVTASSDGQMVAGAILLRGDTFLHYHLSATQPDARVPGATNAILLKGAEMGQAFGLQRMHLGGGITAGEDDALLRFKRRMATDAHTFRIGNRIHDTVAYADLQESWRHAHPQLVSTYGSRVLCYRYVADTRHKGDGAAVGQMENSGRREPN